MRIRVTGYRLGVAILVCVLCLTLISGLCLSAAESSHLRTFEPVFENAEAVLYIDPLTTVVAVQSKITGDTWFSSPPGERVPRETFAFTYFLPGGAQGRKSSHTDSVSLGQYTLEKIDGGVRIRYDLGRRWKKEDALPVMIEKERFEELILGRLSKKADRDLFLDSYYLLTAVLMEPGEEKLRVAGIADISTVLGDYTLTSPDGKLSTSNRTKAAETLLNQIVNNRGDIGSKKDLTYENLEPFIKRIAEKPVYVLNDRLYAFDRNDMIALVNEIGYTGDDAWFDHEAHFIDPPTPALDVFSVTVEYLLDGSDLVVRIPTEDIKYPVDVRNTEGDRVTYSIDRIDLLTHFGAASNTETGYMLVPEGSGGLIYLNSVKDARFLYRQTLYGPDNAVPQDAAQMPPSLPQIQSYLPVFGMKKGNQAFLAIIEQGDTYASVSATVAGQSGPYNCVYSSFTLVPSGQAKLRMADEIGNLYGYPKTRRLVQTRPFMGEIRVRYCFLHGEDADYAGMAKSYRRYLETEKDFTPLADTVEGIPVYASILGAIYTTRSVLGRPTEVIEPLTSYSGVTRIVSDLLGRGVQDLGVVLDGWMQGGITHSYPDAVRLERKLGTERDFLAMVDHLKVAGVRLYPNAEFLHVSSFGDTLFDSFRARSHAARTMEGLVAQVKKENRVRRQLEETLYYVLSPQLVPGVIDAFLRDYSRYQIGGISLSSMGQTVNSDLRLDAFFDREQYKRMVVDQLVALKNGAGDILVHGANGYALPYVDVVVGVPSTGGGSAISDRSIPFYHMVVHGYMDYCGDPINLSGDVVSGVLRCVELGLSPYFVIADTESYKTKDSEFNYLYSINYSDWADVIAASYRVVNEALGDLRHVRIVGHAELALDVFQTEYEDGTRILVNYRNEPVEIDGVLVGARNYRKVR